MYLTFLFINLIITAIIGIILWKIMPKITVKDIIRYIVLGSVFTVSSTVGLLFISVFGLLGLLLWLFNTDPDDTKVIKTN